MSDSVSTNSNDDAATTTSKWSASRVRLLIEIRLNMELEFRKGDSKYLLWPRIHNKMKRKDPAMLESIKDLRNKFSNLMTTYRRIKYHSRTNVPTKWEYFEDFDKVLSPLDDIPKEEEQPSNVRYFKIEKLDDSVSFSSEDSNAPPFYRDNSQLAYAPVDSFLNTVGNAQEINGLSTTTTLENIRETKKRKIEEDDYNEKYNVETSEGNDDASWFREYVQLSELREQQRHNNRMEMERKRLDIETQKLHILREFVDVMKEFVKK